MKKIIILTGVCLIIITAGLLYLKYGGGKNYVNQNIPLNYKYTRPDQIIPAEFVMPRVQNQTGDRLVYLNGEEYDNQYFYQKEGKIYCKGNNAQPETITYYTHTPPGYWFFAKMGGYSIRNAFTCSDKYFIDDLNSGRGPNIYGPFDLK